MVGVPFVEDAYGINKSPPTCDFPVAWAHFTAFILSLYPKALGPLASPADMHRLRRRIA